MDFRCPRCGCRTYHYNSSRIAYICDRCGSPVRNEEEEKARERFDRTYRKAYEHCSVGNYQECLNLLSGLSKDYPVEKKLYQLILRAATLDYTDLEMGDSYRRNCASDAWNRLQRLGALEGAALRYSDQRYRKERSELEEKERKIIWKMVATAVLLLVCSVFLESGESIAVLISGVCVYFLMKRILSEKPLRTITKLHQYRPDRRNNPFREEGS